MFLKGAVEQITQIGGGAVGTDGLDRLTAESLIKSVVIIILAHRRTHDQRVVVKSAQCADALVFFIRQHGFETGQRLVIMIKRVKDNHHGDDGRKQQDTSYKKRSDKFSVGFHSYLLII